MLGIMAYILLSFVPIINAQAQTALLEYMQGRMGVLEDRIAQWHDHSSRYSSELRDFKNQVLKLLENIEKERDSLRNEMENTNIRVDRLEREVDYIETQNPAPPCVDIDEKLTELHNAKKKKNEKYAKLTGCPTAEIPGIVETDEIMDPPVTRKAYCSDTISQVNAMKILKRFGSTSGLWTKDPIENPEKVYVFDGTGNDTVYVYPRMKEFTLFSTTRKAAKIKLPFPWIGTGHVVYGGNLYYIRQGDEFQVIKFNLANKTVVDSAVLQIEEQVPVYGLSTFNYIDIVADEEGLWVIYATKENEKNICLAKLDPSSLGIEQMWDTPCPIENAESAFVVCGSLYVVYNTKLPSRSRIQCVFDVSGTISSENVPIVYFPKRYGSHSSMKYNPREKQIYAWDDGYQIIYKLSMKPREDLY
ncbi:olfactomedin-like protein 3 isoform X1 [Spea bombifrons]|uniref:olfactomedin-like protein 3 isoform X1 n=1 Tax=Spea bombifrons TaxID=233779 RepID=UPI00234AA187|nr:olfactomedin-like protein 3 isoform X1 [Spea bombifrons]